MTNNRRTRILEVSNLSLSGNEVFSSEEILNTFSTRETPNWLSQGFYSIFGEKLGSPPSYFEQVAFDADIDRLKRLYEENGFFDIRIQPNFIKNFTKRTIDISISINENIPAIIDSISYGGVNEVDRSLRNEIQLKSLLRINSRYNASLLNSEISRVIVLFQNSGYPFAQFIKDSSSVSRFLSNNRIIINLCFSSGPLKRYGTTSFNISSPTTDTISYDVLTKQIDFKPDDIYSQEKKDASERNLNRLGVFEAARLDMSITNADSLKNKIPITIVGKLRPKHDLAPEISFSDENNAFNIGFGGGYTDRNFFGGARNFRSRLIFRVQSIQSWEFNRVFGKGGLRDPSVIGSIDLTFSLTQPYVFARSITANTSLTFRLEKQLEYIQNIVRGSYGLTDQLATYTQGFFDWSLERSQVDTLSGVNSSFSLKEETRPQFNSIFSITLQRDKTNDIFSPTKGFFHSATVEESGNLSPLIHNLQPDLPFTQFYKTTILGRWYFETGRDGFSTLALKLKTGYQDKYGSSKDDTLRKIPINRRFFAGGSGSVRGWRSRELGAKTEVLKVGGNFLLEGNMEERINVFNSFYNEKPKKQDKTFLKSRLSIISSCRLMIFYSPDPWTFVRIRKFTIYLNIRCV